MRFPVKFYQILKFVRDNLNFDIFQKLSNNFFSIFWVSEIIKFLDSFNTIKLFRFSRNFVNFDLWFQFWDFPQIFICLQLSGIRSDTQIYNSGFTTLFFVNKILQQDSWIETVSPGTNFLTIFLTRFLTRNFQNIRISRKISC